MTRVVTCPQCAAQLAVPAAVSASALVRCPYCSSQFAVDGNGVRELRSVTLVESQSEPASDETPLSSQATLSSGSDDKPTLASLMERFRDIPRFTETASGNDDDDERMSGQDETVVSGDSHRANDPFDFDTGALGIESQPNFDYQPDALESTESVIATSEPDPAERAFVAEMVSVAQNQQRRARGSRSLVRQIVGVVGGGVIGLTLGYFALLWWRGPDGDLLGVADRIPSALLPDSFDAPAAALASAAPESPPQEPVSDVEPATFVGTPPNTPDAAEPQPLEPQDAEPLLPKATLLDAPSYTLDELNTALQVAETARDGLLAGKLSDPAAKRTKGESYVKLCQIAETVTFLDEQGTADTDDPLSSAAQFFGELLRNAAAREEIGQIAARWIAYPSRPHGGVFFAGTIRSSKQAGLAHELQLELAGGETVTVLSPEAADSQAGLVGVVGSIVEQPAERVAGYTGTADRAVWSRLVFPLE